MSLNLWWVQYISDGSDDDGDDDIDKDALKRIPALIQANEPSAVIIATCILYDWGRKYEL